MTVQRILQEFKGRGYDKAKTEFRDKEDILRLECIERMLTLVLTVIL